MLAYIALGGLLGTLARYGLQGWIQPKGEGGGRHVPARHPRGQPHRLVRAWLHHPLRYRSTVVSPELRGGLTIGFCGAFTTMSTFSYESMKLLADGEYGYAGLYMGGTVLGCLAAVMVGTALANRLL